MLWLLALAGGASLLAVSLTQHQGGPRAAVLRLPVAYAGPMLPSALPLTSHQARVVKAARAQVGDVYDASYCTLSYPNGDPPRGTGACTDVVIRSLRADGIDLQALVHADMTRHWDRYPHRWGLSRPDPLAVLGTRAIPSTGGVKSPRDGRSHANRPKLALGGLCLSADRDGHIGRSRRIRP